MYWQALIAMIIVSTATASIAFTISQAKIFHGFREWVGWRNTWLGALLRCTLCCTVWIAPVLLFITRKATGLHGLDQWLIHWWAVVCLASIWVIGLFKAYDA